MNDQNLRPAQPGEVRNPGGKPKGTLNRSTIAKRVLGLMVKDGLTENQVSALRKMYGDHVDKMTLEEAITLVQVGDAISGKQRTNSYNAVMNSAYGAPKQSVELTGEDGGPLEMSDVTKLTDEELRQRVADRRARIAAIGTGTGSENPGKG
jgi:hypothetical protein